MDITPWFEPGFNPLIQAQIQAMWPANPTLACQDEARRWAKRLLEANPEMDIELTEGFFMLDGDPDQAEGHMWLLIDGDIFDPTAMQFKGEIAAVFYEVHLYHEGDDLLAHLADYGMSPTT